VPVQVVDLVVGTGAELATDKIITVHYMGFIQGTGGQPDQPIIAPLASGEKVDIPVDGEMLITGWNEGVRGMRVGGKRRITIPPELAFEDTDFGDIVPKGSTLIFEVELFDVKDIPD
jgi:peptidylprolyl isomerase